MVAGVVVLSRKVFYNGNTFNFTNANEWLLQSSISFFKSLHQMDAFAKSARQMGDVERNYWGQVISAGFNFD